LRISPAAGLIQTAGWRQLDFVSTSTRGDNDRCCGGNRRIRAWLAVIVTELAEEILSYHRDEDYKIVRLRDDLISATRYAFMMRHTGKLLDDCEVYGRSPGVDGAQYDPRPPRRDRSDPRTQFARGSPNHPDGACDIWSV
jgi:hypothetical protein